MARVLKDLQEWPTSGPMNADATSHTRARATGASNKEDQGGIANHVRTGWRSPTLEPLRSLQKIWHVCNASYA